MTPKGSTLGGLIRSLRQERGWTLRQMSEKVGIPLSTLAKVEQDKLSLTYDKLQQFTSRLGLTLAEFLAHDTSARTASMSSASWCAIRVRSSSTCSRAASRSTCSSIPR